MVLDALASGKCYLANSGGGEAHGHVIPAALEATGEVREGAVFVVGQSGLRREGLKQCGTEGCEVGTGGEGLLCAAGLHGAHKFFVQ